jgi:hypothetical protein
MSNQRYTPEFKDEAVRQVVERGCLRSSCLWRPGKSIPAPTPPLLSSRHTRLVSRIRSRKLSSGTELFHIGP